MLIESTSADGLHKLVFDSVKHTYDLDGKRVPGATAVNSAYPKHPRLIEWMVKQGIEEFQNKTKLKVAGDIGTVLHKFIECTEKGVPFDQKLVDDSPHKPVIEKVLSEFTLWKDTNKDEVILSEQVIAHPEWMAAGQIDTLRRRDGKIVLSDWKTAKSIYVTAILQVAGGYRAMVERWLGMKVDLVEIVKFPKDKKGELEVLTADADGWVMNGKRTEVPGLFDKMTAQYKRNLGTFNFQYEVEKKLSDIYDAKYEGFRKGRAA